MSDKQWVVIRRNDGIYKIWADYGHIAWGSPEYEVIGYAKTHKLAQALREDHKNPVCHCQQCEARRCG